jgi:hypothetical protein
MDIPEKALRHSGMLLAGIQPCAPLDSRLKPAGMTNRAQQTVDVFTEIT